MEKFNNLKTQVPNNPLGDSNASLSEKWKPSSIIQADEEQ